MAEEEEKKEFNAPGLDGAGRDWGEEDEGLSDEELAGVELPDNLTFISSRVNEHSSPGKKDWGTGIQARNFRVGSPTMYCGGDMRGLLDDLEGFSCSDSEESWADEEEEAEVDREGGARIEFHGENLAEAIEGEDESKAREEKVARDRDQEAAMVRNNEWDPSRLCESEDDGEVLADVQLEVIQAKDEVIVEKPSSVLKKAADEVQSDQTWTPSEPIIDQELVLSHLGLQSHRLGGV